MIEDEAKTRWCPFARYVFGATDYPAGNRFEGESSTAAEAAERCLCIASDCMSWRWSEEKRTAAYLQAVVEHMKTTGDTFNKATQEVVKRRAEFAHTEGFCGLAGAPQ